MPTAMIALMAVCPTRMMRFSLVKKDGERTEKIPTRTNRAINALSRKRRTPNERRDNPEASAGRAGDGELARVLLIGQASGVLSRRVIGLRSRARRKDQRLFRHFVMQEFPGYFALRQNQDAIRDSEHFGQFGGNKKHRQALLGETVHYFDTLRFRPHVDSSGRLV
jgi:hypothetical protein